MPRRGRNVAQVLGALVSIAAIGMAPTWVAAAGTGDERVYQDVNTPRFDSVEELQDAAEVVVVGTVTASTDHSEGLMRQTLHQVTSVELDGTPREAIHVVQDRGSIDGAVHVEQQLLEVDATYLLFLQPDGEHYRTVGGEQGLLELVGDRWVSVAPSRTDLAVPASEVTVALPITAPAETSAEPTQPIPPAEDLGPVAETPPEEPADGSSWVPLALVFLGGLVLGGAVAFAVSRRQSAPDAAATPPRTLTAAAPNPARETVTTHDGSTRVDSVAVHGLIAVADITDSPVVMAQVERSLRQAGVEMLPTTEGDAFDTNLHHGLGWQPAPRPELAQTVARVVRPGWRADGHLLRPADVEVYRNEHP